MRLRISASGYALALCAAIALGVAACGGGGGSATSAIVTNPSPTPTTVSCLIAHLARSRAAIPYQLTEKRMPAVSAPIGPGPAKRVCPHSGPGLARCLAWLRTDVMPATGPAGYSPANLQTAYGLTAASTTNGAGQVVALVDAYDDANAESDLAVYRSTFGLTACTTANSCFTKVNQNGNGSPLPGKDTTGGWEAEESLDLDMVSAICPNCSIVLIETNSPVTTDLYKGEDTAATACGATVISDSWGTSEYAGETSDDTHFKRAGIVITAAAGDNGYGVGYPSASQYVTSVGGTHLVANTYTQTAWSGTGSGCSAFEPQPSWQTALGPSYTNLCGKRIANDVSMDADPNTGVAVYDTTAGSMGCPSPSHWCVIGGTSASSPMIGAVYALAGNGSTVTWGSYPYSHTASLTDITAGSNGVCGGTYLCTAGVGFDGPTGLGTPLGVGGF